MPWTRVPVVWVAPDDFPGLPFLSKNSNLSVNTNVELEEVLDEGRVPLVIGLAVD